jgi:hypothetical protein
MYCSTSCTSVNPQFNVLERSCSTPSELKASKLTVKLTRACKATGIADSCSGIGDGANRAGAKECVVVCCNAASVKYRVHLDAVDKGLTVDEERRRAQLRTFEPQC